MKKYKLLRFGHSYINREGDLAIHLMGGCKKKGYKLAASSAHPNVWLGKIQILSRIVPNDGNWIEVDARTFNAASSLLVRGYKVKIPA